MDSLSTVIASIFLWISSHLHVISADFKQPPNYPEIRFINQGKLSDMACEKPCPVIGWYPTKDQIKGKEVLYMIEGVYPVKDLCIRTILLHELVHFWQDYNDAFENNEDSQKVVFTRREQQARILEHLFHFSLLLYLVHQVFDCFDVVSQYKKLEDFVLNHLW